MVFVRQASGLPASSLLPPHSHDGTDSPADSDDIIVVLNNFKSRIIKVKVCSRARFRSKWNKPPFSLIISHSEFFDWKIAFQVQKKQDKLDEELLSDGTEENDTGFWKSLTR